MSRSLGDALTQSSKRELLLSRSIYVTSKSRSSSSFISIKNPVFLRKVTIVNQCVHTITWTEPPVLLLALVGSCRFHLPVIHCIVSKLTLVSVILLCTNLRIETRWQHLDFFTFPIIPNCGIANCTCKILVKRSVNSFGTCVWWRPQHIYRDAKWHCCCGNTVQDMGTRTRRDKERGIERRKKGRLKGFQNHWKRVSQQELTTRLYNRVKCFLQGITALYLYRTEQILNYQMDKRAVEWLAVADKYLVLDELKW